MRHAQGATHPPAPMCRALLCSAVSPPHNHLLSKHRYACWTVAAAGCTLLVCCVWFTTQHMSSGTCMHGHSEILLLQNHPTLSCMQPGCPMVTAHLIQPPPCSSTAAEQANERPVGTRFFLLDSTPLPPSNNPSQAWSQKATVSTPVTAKGRDQYTSIQNWRSLRTAGARWGNWSRTAQHGSFSVCRDCKCRKHTCAPHQQDTQDTVHCL